MSRRPLRRRRYGRRNVCRPMPRGILLPRGVGVRCSLRARVLLSGGLCRENKRCRWVVCHRGRGRVHPERPGRVLSGIERRRKHASVRDVHRRKVSGQHRRVERADSKLMDCRKHRVRKLSCSHIPRRDRWRKTALRTKSEVSRSPLAVNTVETAFVLCGSTPSREANFQIFGKLK